MPITLNEIQKLKRLSTANFHKHTCENCSGEYFSIRQSKFCTDACKQQAYRERLLNGDVIPSPKDPKDLNNNETTKAIKQKLKEQKEELENLIKFNNQ